MPVELPKSVCDVIEKGNEDIRSWLREQGWHEEPWPKIVKKNTTEGEAVVQSHPILGIEKYLGMVDSDRRIAHFPSVKLTNDSFRTKTYVKFDPVLKDDVIILDGAFAADKGLKRIQKILAAFRSMTGITTKCLLISRHFGKAETKAKGLGLSAASGGAVARTPPTPCDA